jgi:hypothetical protein
MIDVRETRAVLAITANDDRDKVLFLISVVDRATKDDFLLLYFPDKTRRVLSSLLNGMVKEGLLFRYGASTVFYNLTPRAVKYVSDQVAKLTKDTSELLSHQIIQR